MKRFSKSIFLTILVVAMTIALVGCASSAKAEELEPATAAPAQETPAAEPAAEPAAPAAEPAAPAAEPAAEAANEWIVPLLGYEAKIVYADKVATITYPSFITNEEVLNAAIAAYEMYPAYFEGTSVKIEEEGKGVAYITFPAEVSNEDLDAAINLIAAALPEYIDSVLFPEINRTVDVYGFQVAVSYKNKVAKITYPATITKAEVAEAARTAYNAFEKYLQGTELSIGEGEAYLTFPVAITEDDIDYAVAMLSAYLPEYIEAVLAQAQAEEVAVVAEEPAAAPAEEAPAAAPAEEAPAAAPAQEAPAASSSTSSSSTTSSSTSTSSSSSTSSTPASTASSAASAAQAQVAKKSNVGLIIVIIVLIIAAGAAVAIILKKKKG